jgi:hypothetical protein
LAWLVIEWSGGSEEQEGGIAHRPSIILYYIIRRSGVALNKVRRGRVHKVRKGREEWARAKMLILDHE